MRKKVIFFIICFATIILVTQIQWTETFFIFPKEAPPPLHVNFTNHIFNFGRFYYDYFLRRDDNWKNKTLCDIPQEYKELIKSICWDPNICGSQIPCQVLEPKVEEVHSWEGATCFVHESLSSLKPATHVIFPEADWLKVTDPIFQSLENIRALPQSPNEIFTPGIWMFWLVWESTVYYNYADDPRYISRFNVTVGSNPKFHKIRQVIFPYHFVSSVLDGKPDITLHNKTDHAPVVMMISNCQDKNKRLEYIEELMKYIKVDSYGTCLNNMNDAERIKAYENGFWDYKREILSKYHFTLAFENSNAVGYVSEKVWNALQAGSIPIYMGAPDIDEFMPAEDAVIKTSDFGSPKDLATYLYQVLNDTELYNKHKEWYLHPINPSFRQQAAKPRELSHGQTMCSILHNWNNLTGIDDTILKR